MNDNTLCYSFLRRLVLHRSKEKTFVEILSNYFHAKDNVLKLRNLKQSRFFTI
jgi:hypothetical protein